MEIGDLVEIRECCSNAGDLALVVHKEYSQSNYAQVMFCKTGNVNEAHSSNVRVVASAKR